LYLQWYRLYDIPVPERGKPWQFKYLTVNHICYPPARRRGKILTLLRAHGAQAGDRAKKLFQFLNEIGARALRMHLGRVLEMAESSPDKAAYETENQRALWYGATTRFANTDTFAGTDRGRQLRRA
jgi:hypothetical protein